jgi:hypothetical protein
VVEHSIGNGEVDSSILSGSTSFVGLSGPWRFFPHWRPTQPPARKRKFIST